MQRFSFRHLLNVQETLPYYVVCLYMLSLDIVSVLATFTFTNDVLKHVHTHTHTRTCRISQSIIFHQNVSTLNIHYHEVKRIPKIY